MMNLDEIRSTNPNELYEKLELDIPVDPFEAARKLQVMISTDFDISRMGKSGEIYWEDDDPIIWINPLDAEVRQRFTLAHELGHYLYDCLKKNGEGNVCVKYKSPLQRSEHWDGKEYGANKFAARFLMPRQKVLEVAREIIDAYKAEHPTKKIKAKDLILKLAEHFGVSAQAMKFRLINMKVLPQSASKIDV